MYYNNFQDIKLSALGFGTMRLPLIPGGTGKDIDMQQLDEMVKYAMENGVNYFDTAYPYHESCSESAIGQALAKYPRDSFYLATKYPGHQISSSYNPAEIFEKQLVNCGVEYFDFYLMHNVNENSLSVYLDPKWGIHDYFKKQKELGRIRHLGFSCHGDVPCMEKYLEVYGDIAEFCQIQMNYLDWSLQNAEAKYDFLTSRGIPVWVMESVRGGKLSHFDEATEAKMKAVNPDKSISSWGFRWLQRHSNVCMILSGMSNLDQMKDNVATFETRNPLGEEETALVYEAAETLKKSVPCTGCRYCCDGCPMGLDIPRMISIYNELQVSSSINIAMRHDAMGESGKPENCIGCGQCAAICPQNLPIPDLMKKMTEKFKEMPNWAEVCRQREAAAKARG